MGETGVSARWWRGVDPEDPLEVEVPVRGRPEVLVADDDDDDEFVVESKGPVLAVVLLR